MALSPDRVRRVYDRIGRLQDTQAFYEDAAIDDLIANSDLGNAHRVIEIGCGTGRLARRLLDRQLPADATYLGVELSPKMAELTRDRLRPHLARSAVTLTDAVNAWPEAADRADRVIATYLFDLLDASATTALLDHIAQCLVSGGLLCAVSLTDGSHGLTRAVSRLWTAVWRRRPGLVGGCRPVQLADTLTGLGWALRHHTTVTAWALTSEIVVAQPRPA